MSGLRGETPKSPRDLTGRKFNTAYAEEAAKQKADTDRDPREYWDERTGEWVIDYTRCRP